MTNQQIQQRMKKLADNGALGWPPVSERVKSSQLPRFERIAESLGIKLDIRPARWPKRPGSNDNKGLWDVFVASARNPHTVIPSKFTTAKVRQVRGQIQILLP